MLGDLLIVSWPATYSRSTASQSISLRRATRKIPTLLMNAGIVRNKPAFQSAMVSVLPNHAIINSSTAIAASRSACPIFAPRLAISLIAIDGVFPKTKHAIITHSCVLFSLIFAFMPLCSALNRLSRCSKSAWRLFKSFAGFYCCIHQQSFFTPFLAITESRIRCYPVAVH